MGQTLNGHGHLDLTLYGDVRGPESSPFTRSCDHKSSR